MSPKLAGFVDEDMSFKLAGFGEIHDWIDGMANDMEHEGFSKWADTIQDTAREICSDHKGSRISIKVSQDMKMEVQCADLEAVESVKKAIKKHQDDMSTAVKVFYTQLLQPFLKDLEKQLKE